MAGLLVSVRSAPEALAAVAGGAAVIDVKEPGRGPLGRADAAVWRAVRAAVPRDVPVSVALGELAEWDGAGPPSPIDLAGIAYRKLGLAGGGKDWRARWSGLCEGSGPAWVAVAYLDWDRAEAPRPEAVLDAAIGLGCAGILFDTWEKGRPAPAIDPGWVERARSSGLRVAVAGGLDEAAIRRLAPLAPDLFAVRGAACRGGDRSGTIDRGRVMRLVRAALNEPDPLPPGGGGGAAAG
jgi:uncharacterized protein (UPF0264 family)